MTIMYVDDSGTPRHTDHVDYFILSGIIVHDDYIKKLQRDVFEYTQSNFVGDLVDSEIHVYDIYNSHKNFQRVSFTTKSNLLDNLYNMIKNLPCIGITIVINKKKFEEQSESKILDMAWSFLLERYDMFLRENAIKLGRIKIDSSSNKTQNAIIQTFHRLTRYGLVTRRLSNIDEPVFVNSAGVYGIQIADAFAYCTLKNRKNNDDFSKYWKIIYSKLRKSNSGKIQGYGYKEHPK